MTQQGPPPAASGLLGTIASSSRVPASTGQGPATQGSVITSVSPRTTIAQLERRIQELTEAGKARTVAERNARRAERRTAGDANVSEDEGDVVAEQVKILLMQQAKDLDDERARAARLGFGGDGAPRLLFKTADLAEHNPFIDEAPTPDAVVDLFGCRVHIPLSVFQSSNLGKVARGELPRSVSRYVDGKKIPTIDLTVFIATEKKLNIGEFYDAWRNLLRILQPHAEADTFQSLQHYWQSLVSFSDFEKSFAAYLSFDINFRTKWFTKPFKITDAVFNKVSTFVTAAFQQQVEDLVGSLQATTAVQKPAATVAGQPRYAPYPSQGAPRTVAAPATGGRVQSFREPSAGPSGQSFRGCCLICAVTGHKAAGCVARTHTDGSPLTCTWRDNKLIHLVHGTYVCGAYNGSRGCQRVDHDGHICSLCGSASHAAVDATCRRTA